ncbi:aspartate aminotransferase family protein [Elizabethkingia bruuniana]|uniref:Aspartate aminotransferase family protein n=1 Tax=Elizabethkingia bruuniana TaxID=1756149 RepID=A0A7T7V187_9FLAO|nr:pyridoxal-dependent decarboxylase [Elizabethkingia bruuniana]KGO11170.1 amino acid decarboxylase [Elizabethkingia miricola]AQX86408.1 amino acid decarboxylase [Elizabethkingia bruuniana]KUY24919.1 amino acid decarboxylase [Elizabethkingia bruuniana]OPB61974.1 amino acid decarboxylase [Elizabethkingia bruuniana]QQN59946.1 aspartate aminotransferase family protein [Elizabethkingia bruuniana]
MKESLKSDSLQIEHLLNIIKEQGVEYLNSISERATSVDNKLIPEKQALPEEGYGTEEVLKLFNKRFEPLMVASSGPRYLGFVTGGSTPASVAGDWLSTIYDQNTQSVKGHGDISAVIELEAIAMLLDLLELPKSFLGGFVTGAMMSNFTCVAVARQWYGKEKEIDIAKEGITIPIHILTAIPHSSAIKSLSLLGIGSGNIIKIKTEEGNREAISIKDLEDHIQKLNGDPFILISSGGTVNTVDFDDFTAIRKLKEKYNFWWHIDAAFGGFAACSDTYKHLVKDWEYADSITVDCHKWLNVPYESAVFFIKEQYKLLQVETFQNSNAPYLGDPLESFNYLNFLPENSRRLKALPAWFSLMAYGKDGYRDIVENSIFCSNQFGEFIESSDDFELLAPVRLNTICFTLKGEEKQDMVNQFLELLNATGKVFMTPTNYNQRKGIRAAFVNWRTTEHDVKLITEAMAELATDLK